MQRCPKFHNLLVLPLLILFGACNNHSSDPAKTVKDTMGKDSATSLQPPSIMPPKVEMKAAIQKCFVNEGLKYKTTVTMNIGDTEIMGTVSSEPYDSDQKEKTAFEGTIRGDQLTVKFKGTPPITGDASEWTSKPWIIKKKGNKEILLIVFKEKNYDTRKWAESNVAFEAVSCQ